MTTEHEVAIKIGGRDYCIVSDDGYVDTVGPDFEPQMVKLFNAVIDRNGTTIDVGANIGLTTILFSALSKHVISFEASSTTCAYLRKNVDRAQLRNATIINIGLADTNGRSEITFAPNNRSGGFVSDKTKASVGHTVETIELRRLDDIQDELLLHDLRFMKLDVEGYEKFVLLGARNVVNHFKPSVVLELNHWCLNAFQRITVPDFFDFIMSIFPITLAVHQHTYLDLRAAGDRYTALYRHIVQGEFCNVLCAFDPAQLTKFYADFVHA